MINRNCKGSKKLFQCVVLCLMLSFLQVYSGTGLTAEAAPAKLELTGSVGFGAGNVKQGRWFPAAFTLTNPGDDLAGDLTVTVAGTNGDRDYSYVQHVELPKGSTKAVTMLLPGGNYAKDNNRIAFYAGSAEKGKAVEIDGKDYLETVSMPAEVLQIGVIARDPDTLNFMAVLNQPGKRVNILHLAGNDISGDELAMDGLDMLVLNDFASDVWKEEQVKAIQAWVQRGGTLLLAGGAGYPKTAAPFASIAPAAYQGTVSVTQLPELAKDGEKELALSEPFTLSKAQPVKDAKIFLSEGDTPIFVQKAFGLGHVWYAAYDLALNPLASWNGNPRLWEKVLGDRISQAVNNQGNMKFGPEPYWEMNRALEFFSSLKPPRIGMLAWTLFLYAVVVGPILYFILRRMDRREWA